MEDDNSLSAARPTKTLILQLIPGIVATLAAAGFYFHDHVSIWAILAVVAAIAICYGMTKVPAAKSQFMNAAVVSLLICYDLAFFKTVARLVAKNEFALSKISEMLIAATVLMFVMIIPTVIIYFVIDLILSKFSNG